MLQFERIELFLFAANANQSRSNNNEKRLGFGLGLDVNEWGNEWMNEGMNELKCIEFVQEWVSCVKGGSSGELCLELKRGWKREVMVSNRFKRN